MKHRRLQELDHSDFEIVDGEPDIRGWDVKNASGQKIGEVEDLIVDAAQKKVRYMVVDLGHNDLDLDDRKVLLPIGLAELDTKEDDVLIPRIQTEQLRGLPVYDKDHLDSEVEGRICSTLGRTGDRMQLAGNAEPNPEFYRHDYFNDDNLYRNRSNRTSSAQAVNNDYERGLRLWESGSQGGIVGSGTDINNRSGNDIRREESYRGQGNINEQDRMQRIRNRRDQYEQRRQVGGMDQNRGSSYGHERSVEKRIREEGLRDPDEQ
ncbi:MAG TPA: PRC-barrel domain-containing protein [Flavisolibacter sp.]|nr:PRC-barrel domain-containing protein [Flavisolibacter sp.]